mmetsp:Transcript_35734/g.96997  ORF Transcript_35734/g.96997 Transcript_35734/m.96997 type:complete len:223 (-) Transcript_35734:369-1037(-)
MTPTTWEPARSPQGGQRTWGVVGDEVVQQLLDSLVNDHPHHSDFRKGRRWAVLDLKKLANRPPALGHGVLEELRRRHEPFDLIVPVLVPRFAPLPDLGRQWGTTWRPTCSERAVQHVRKHVVGEGKAGSHVQGLEECTTKACGGPTSSGPVLYGIHPRSAAVFLWVATWIVVGDDLCIRIESQQLFVHPAPGAVRNGVVAHVPHPVDGWPWVFVVLPFGPDR